MNDIKNKIIWLKENGHEKEVFDLCMDIGRAFNAGLKSDITAIERRYYRYVGESMIVLDRIYFKEFGEHICRIFNDRSKQDTYDFATEVINAIWGLPADSING